MSTAIRVARPGDGAALASLHEDMGAYYAELAPQHFCKPDTDGLAAELDSDLRHLSDEALALVAEADGSVVGALWAVLMHPSPDARRQIDPAAAQARVHIDYVVSSPAHRRQGIAGRLVTAAEAWGRENGATIVEATTYRTSPLSFPFWTDRMGLQEHSVNLRKPLF